MILSYSLTLPFVLFSFSVPLVNGGEWLIPCILDGEEEQMMNAQKKKGYLLDDIA